MRQVTIGVIAYEDPDRLQRTLANLRQNTSMPFTLVLLLDGPDSQILNFASSIAEAIPSITDTPRGAAACFNRLAALARSEIIVLLESGSLAGPLWLDHLLAALCSDSHVGLAGPSTNRSWNDQCLLHHGPPQKFGCTAGNSAAEVSVIAEEVRKHFKNDVRPLEPLHSLGDFCYAVRLEVVETIGAADEAYGLGPCWEMDYNIRAARSAFRGVWACSSYVHRMAISPRREAEERQLFDQNRRLYQDRFCARHLRHVNAEYRGHCRGDACENFAPVGLIQLQIPFSASRPPLKPSPPIEIRPAPHLVSCIMPTRNRPEFVRQSIRYFLRQDYPSRELLILDDSDSPISLDYFADSRIRHVILPPGHTIGAKRNRGCEMAHGRYIAHWDDDDWYAPDRLTRQIEPIFAGRADLTGFTQEIFFDLDRWEFWTCSPDLHRRMFVEDLHGGTLVFDRRLFERGARYPHASLAEDAAFLKQAAVRGARVERVRAGETFLYLRHSASSWSFACGHFLDPRGWLRCNEPAFLQTDKEFYASRSRARTPQITDHALSLPHVTCIMPTAGRLALAAQAVRYFQRQDYPNRELLILDDGPIPCSPPVPPDPRIRYFRLDGKRSVGAKRNIAGELASGDIIAHWDDDDWCAPDRLSLQVASLLKSENSHICGLARINFFDPLHSRAWTYDYSGGARAWVAGGTLCYWRTFWQRNPFPDVSDGEDTRFVWADRQARICALPDSSFYVATVHPRNTSPKRTGDSRWRALPVARIRELLVDDWSFYEGWRALGSPPDLDPPMQSVQAFPVMIPDLVPR